MAFKSDKQRKAFFAKKDTIRADIVPKFFPGGNPIPQELRRKIFNEVKRIERKQKQDKFILKKSSPVRFKILSGDFRQGTSFPSRKSALKFIKKNPTLRTLKREGKLEILMDI